MYFCKRLIFLISSIVQCTSSFGQLWLDLDSGFKCQQYTGLIMDLYADEQNNRILAAGLLPFQNCEEYNVPAAWNGKHWNKLGAQGLHNLYTAIGIYNNEIYSGTSYFGEDTDGFIKLVNNTWDSIPNGPQTIDFTDFEVNNDILYVAAAFNYCNGDSANLVFIYDGENIEPLINYFNNSTKANCIEFYHDTLFVGGKFYDDDRHIYHFASVFGGDIHQVGQGIGIDAIVEDMVVYEDKLWLAGGFGPGTIGNEEQVYLAYYDGHEIHPAPVQTDGRIVALEVYDWLVFSIQLS
jgi:hypothetical protein